MDTSSVLMFAIQAGIQLHGAIRKSYIDGTMGRPLHLPLPRSGDVDWTSAHAWFSKDNGANAAPNPRAQELIASQQLTDDEKTELVEIYHLARAIDDGHGGGLGAEELGALLVVRQWDAGRYGDNPTALQRVGGTIINIAVDYFLETPGAISEQRPEGQALRIVLKQLDTCDFAEEAVADIAPMLLTGVLEAVSETPALMPGGKNEKLLLESVTKSLAEAARDHLDHATITERRDAGVWLGLIARTVVRSSAETILEQPRRFFDVGENEADLVSRVGGAMAELVIGEDSITFHRLLSGEGLARLTEAVISAVAANPDLLKIGNQGIKAVLVALAKDIEKAPGLLAPDMLVELARLILERTAENMDLIWGKRFSRPDRHLLVTATRTLLVELSRSAPGGWRPVLTRDQILAIAQAVFDEVIDNPAWLIARADASSPMLAEALRAIIDALREVDGSLLSADTFMSVIRIGLGAVALRAEFLDRLPGDAGAQGRIAITALLDAIFSTITDENAPEGGRWRLARNSTILMIVEIVIDELAEFEIDQEAIDKVREAIKALLEYDGPFEIETLVDFIRSHLESDN